MLLGDREASMGKRIADQPVRIEVDLPIMFVVAVRAHGQHRTQRSSWMVANRKLSRISIHIRFQPFLSRTRSQPASSCSPIAAWLRYNRGSALNEERCKVQTILGGKNPEPFGERDAEKRWTYQPRLPEQVIDGWRYFGYAV